MSDVLVFTIIVLVVALVLFGVGFLVRQYMCVQEARKQARIAARELQAETVRLASLPKLRTQCLLRVPTEDNPANARTFGGRWNRIIVWDEYGQAWVGYKCLDVMTDLVFGEFTEENYWVPFCGPGEMTTSRPVTIEDKTFELYPTYLKGKPVDGPDWQEWLMVVNRCKNDRYQEYGQMVAEERIKSLKDRREHYGNIVLATS